MVERRYEPPPIPLEINSNVRRYLEEQLEEISYLINSLLETVETSSGGSSDFQNVYDVSTTEPQIQLDSTTGPLTLRDTASSIGNLFELQDNSGDAFTQLGENSWSFGKSTRRVVEIVGSDDTTRGGMELWPDDMTLTSSSIPLSGLYWNSTITSNVAGGGVFGNDRFGSVIEAAGTINLEDAGFFVDTGTLFKNFTTLNMEANSGPFYTLLDAGKIRADTNNVTMTNYVSYRWLPQFGSNVNSGTLTVNNIDAFLFGPTVNNSGGGTTVTNMNCMNFLALTNGSGATVTNFAYMKMADVPAARATNIFGINSAMNDGTFINHTGTAPTKLGGDLEIAGDVGFYGTAAAAKPTVTGATGGNVALQNLLTALAGLGLLTDSTT